MYRVDIWWFGFQDQDVEGEWAWLGGDPVDYTDWGVGEPNDDYWDDSTEDCAHYNWYGDGAWNDYACADPGYFVCEETSG